MMTAAFIEVSLPGAGAGPHPDPPPWTRGRERAAGAGRGPPQTCQEKWSFQFDRVVFDDRVGEQFLAHRLDFFPRRGLVAIGKVDLDQLALAYLADASKAERRQRVADRLALR